MCAIRSLSSSVWRRYISQNSIEKQADENPLSVFIPCLRRTVSEVAKEISFQIARLWICIPSGFNFRFSVRPKLRPNRAIVFQIVLPMPKNFSVRRPKSFFAGFATAGINDFVLLGAILVKTCFLAIEQIMSARTNPRAPLRTDFSVWITFRKLFNFAAGIFWCDVAGIWPNPCPVQHIVQTRLRFGRQNMDRAIRRLPRGDVAGRAILAILMVRQLHRQRAGTLFSGP